MRLAILCLLLAGGSMAGYFVWSTERAVHQLDDRRESKRSTIDRLLSSISAIATAQQAFTDFGRQDVASFTRVSLLVDRITTDAAGLRAAAESSSSSARLEEFWTALSALMGAESRARERLASGDESGAADAILASSREHVNVLNSTLQAFREAELENFGATRAAMMWRSWASLGIAGLVWGTGLIAFALIPWRRPAPVVVTQPAAQAVSMPAPIPGGAVPSIDLAAAADLAADLSRLSDQAALPGLLKRAAEILGARGIVVWMGAGGELYAVAEHGYENGLLARIRPIARLADNATAAAWRSGELCTVPADVSGYGAIVAPLLSPAGCVGVLAAEVGSERERDEATHAVAVILAAQLSGVLAAWPAASTTESDEGPLDRKAAAS
jgi:hypothetical protein